MEVCEVGKKEIYYNKLIELSIKSKNLYNSANYYVRQVFFQTTELKDRGVVETAIWLRYQDIYKIMKNTKQYKELPAKTAQQVLMLLDKDWVSFFKSVKEYKVNPGKFKGQPRPPRYKKGYNTLVFTNQQGKIKEGYLIIPKVLKIKTKLKSFQQVKISYINGVFSLYIVYNKEVPDLKEEIKNVVGLDLGVNNFITMTNNVGKIPVVINGRIIKSINQYYNKELAFQKSRLKKETGSNWSKGLDKLTLKRNNKVKDFIHKSSRFVVNYCLEHGIDTIVVGNNDGWKQGVDMSKVNNQNFVQIPFEMLISQLIYKGQEVGIRVVVTEESYTSKASFLDNDIIPKYDPNNTIKYKFSGYRVERGLYKSKVSERYINSDVNGSYNIMRKVIPNAFADGIEGVGLHPVRYNIA